jgi:hypothetical protein
MSLNKLRLLTDGLTLTNYGNNMLSIDGMELTYQKQVDEIMHD